MYMRVIKVLNKSESNKLSVVPVATPAILEIDAPKTCPPAEIGSCAETLGVLLAETVAVLMIVPLKEPTRALNLITISRLALSEPIFKPPAVMPSDVTIPFIVVVPFM
jgi:hypothetical protein